MSPKAIEIWRGTRAEVDGFWPDSHQIQPGSDENLLSTEATGGYGQILAMA
jgi:hypothetical protein